MIARDDLKHYAKYTGMWLTARGISTLAVLAATVGAKLHSYYVPFVTLPLGLVLNGYMTHDFAEYRKQRMLNAYRREVAATLGKDPREVTVEDLVTVANGDQEAGIPHNTILAEQLDRIGQHKALSVLSAVGAAFVAAICFAFLLNGGVVAGTEEVVQGAPIGNMLFNTATFAAGLVAGAINFVSDHLFHHFGEKAFGLGRTTAYELIKEMKRHISEEYAITPEQVVGVFVACDPDLKDYVTTRFGRPYEELSAREQAYVVERMEQAFPIAELTHKINSGSISPNELAFATEGRSSGVPEREPRTPPTRHQQIFSPEHTPEPEHASEEALKQPESVDASLSHLERYQRHAPARSFAASFVERVAQKSPATGVLRHS